MEEIQKSIKLINFGDSIFDADESSEFDSVDNVVEKPSELGTTMLSSNTSIKYLLRKKPKTEETEEYFGLLSKRKHVKLEELLFSYFNQYEDENEYEYENEDVLREVIVTYSPFLVSKGQFLNLVERESERTKEIEIKCFGTVLSEFKLMKLLEFYEKTFLNDLNPKFAVISSKIIPNQMILKGKLFDVKGLAKRISLFEASEYLKVDFYDFYGKSDKNNFILIFNKFTNFLISEILKTETKTERKLIVKRILKLAKELLRIGAMNSLKGCLTVLESNAIHRLKLIKDQNKKYQNRFKELSNLTSAENNFISLRERACVVPWFGIILRDFTFIKEIVKKSSDATVNVPLALCLRKLMNSMTAAREACKQLLKGSGEEDLKRAAVMGKWLENVEILYETEEEQYRKSLTIE